eukprot:450595_1
MFAFFLMWLSARLSTVHSTGVCLACYKNRDIRTHSETVDSSLASLQSWWKPDLRKLSYIPVAEFASLFERVCRAKGAPVRFQSFEAMVRLCVTSGCPLFAAAITLAMPRFDLKPSPEMVLYFLAGFAKQNSEDRSPIPLVIRDSTALFTGSPMSVHSLANALAPFKALTGTSGFRGALRVVELVAEIRLLPTSDAEIQVWSDTGSKNLLKIGVFYIGWEGRD